MSQDLGNFNLVELLDRMADIAEPEPVSWFPQTTGWVVIGIFVVLFFSFLLWRVLKHSKEIRYRKQALKEIDGMSGRAIDSVEMLTGIARILRRVALVSFPREQVACLFGNDWLKFLERTANGMQFIEGPGRLLTTAPYESAPQPSAQDLLAVRELVTRWIITHQAGSRHA